MGDLSANFNRAEFRCKHCGTLVGPTQRLVTVLQRLRTSKGRALTVISGYRCATHNRRVGGAPSSQHVAGTAADIPPGYATVGEAAAAGAVGIGSKGQWATHVDVREGAPARWQY